ncbi:UNC5C-like protein [Saccostrea echinata]|uniref:UNC5C-like protein n=1 Tax=Saccostrea echinata TaxID=191078 RepID=UPI002A7F1EB7|nr:UNC5C-like protein [Saccostrea echinata]
MKDEECSKYIIWASVTTSIVACGIFFLMWRCVSRRKRNRRESGPSVSQRNHCHDCMQHDKSYCGEFPISHRRNDIHVEQSVHCRNTADERPLPSLRTYQSPVLYPSPVPAGVLSTVSGNVSPMLNTSFREPEEHLNHDIQNQTLNDLGTSSSSCSVSGETSNRFTRPFFYSNDMYTVSERSKMKTVGGKLIVSVAHNVTSSGDCLMLDDMGISLYIPPNAIPNGEETLVCLVLNWDLGDNPYMTETESLVSPVVFVGPHGLKLRKPCELRFRHCAYDPRHIVVMRSETDLYGDKSWMEMYNQENQDDKCSLSSDECRLKINTFTLYTCILRPLRNLKMAKWLQIAAFSNPLEKRIDHHEVRVYFLNKTPCALQWAIQNEAHFQHELLCPEKAFLFYGQVEDILDVRVTLKYLSPEWESIENDEYERVPYLHIWHGQCPHISMCFKKKAQYSVRELNFHLNIYQETLENEGEKIVVHATEESKRIVDNTCIININASQKHESVPIPSVEVNRTEDRVNVSVNPNQSCSVAFLEEVCKSNNSRHYISYDLRNQLKIKLDPLTPLGNDWRQLAEFLEMTPCINYLSSIKSSPTEVLLCVAEHRNIPLAELADALTKMKRYDAERIIRNFLSDQNQLDSDLYARGGHQHDERKVHRLNEFSYENLSYK